MNQPIGVFCKVIPSSSPLQEVNNALEETSLQVVQNLPRWVGTSLVSRPLSDPSRRGLDARLGWDMNQEISSSGNTIAQYRDYNRGLLEITRDY